MDESPRRPAARAEQDAGTPRWVKLSALAAALLAVAVVIVLLLSGGDHGPGRHTGGGDSGGHTAPAKGHAP